MTLRERVDAWAKKGKELGVDEPYEEEIFNLYSDVYRHKLSKIIDGCLHRKEYKTFNDLVDFSWELDFIKRDDPLKRKQEDDK